MHSQQQDELQQHQHRNINIDLSAQQQLKEELYPQPGQAAATTSMRRSRSRRRGSLTTLCTHFPSGFRFLSSLLPLLSSVSFTFFFFFPYLPLLVFSCIFSLSTSLISLPFTYTTEPRWACQLCSYGYCSCYSCRTRCIYSGDIPSAGLCRLSASATHSAGTTKPDARCQPSVCWKLALRLDRGNQRQQEGILSPAFQDCS